MSVIVLISSALPPGADLPGGVAEGRITCWSEFRRLLINFQIDNNAALTNFDPNWFSPSRFVRMSPLGYKRKLRALEIMSALPPEADIPRPTLDFRF